MESGDGEQTVAKFLTSNTTALCSLKSPGNSYRILFDCCICVHTCMYCMSTVCVRYKFYFFYFNSIYFFIQLLNYFLCLFIDEAKERREESGKECSIWCDCQTGNH